MAVIASIEGREPSSLWPALRPLSWGPFQPLRVQRHPSCWRGRLVCERVFVIQGCWSHLSILCYKTSSAVGGFLGTRCRKGRRYLIQSGPWSSGMGIGLSRKHGRASETGSKQKPSWRINQWWLNQKGKAGVTIVFCHWEEMLLHPCICTMCDTGRWCTWVP